jgi:hypothetical protein
MLVALVGARGLANDAAVSLPRVTERAATAI